MCYIKQACLLLSEDQIWFGYSTGHNLLKEIEVSVSKKDLVVGVVNGQGMRPH